MKLFFLIVFLLLSALSGLIYWTTPDRASPVPVLYWVTQDDPVKRETIQLFKSWLRDNQLPPVEVKIDNTNQNATKKLAQGLAGVGADIFDIYPGQAELFGSSGMLMDVSGLAGEYGFAADTTYPALYGDVVIDGRQYGYPRNVGGAACWINRDTLARYGIAEPTFRWTWDDFERIGRAFVTAANPPGTRERSYFMQRISASLLRRGLGLSALNETMTACTLDDPRNAEVMRRLYRWTVELRLIPTQAEQTAMSADGLRAGDATFFLFAQGRYATLYLPRYALIRLRPLGNFNLRVVEPVNSGFANMEFGCGIIAAYAGTKHPQETLRFLQFLTSERFNLLVARSGDGLPPVPKYVNSEAFLRPPGHPNEWASHEVFAKLAPAIGIGYCHSPFLFSGVITRMDKQILDSVLAGRLSPEDAGRVEAGRLNDEIALSLRNNEKLQAKYQRLVKVQARIDALRAAGKKVPAAWITNPFHLAYYRAKGWLEETR